MAQGGILQLLGLPLEPGVYSLEYLESANTKILEALPCRQVVELDVGNYRSSSKKKPSAAHVHSWLCDSLSCVVQKTVS